MKSKKKITARMVMQRLFDAFTLGWILSLLIENGLFQAWGGPVSRYMGLFVTIIALGVITLLLFLNIPINHARVVYIALFCFYLVTTLLDTPWLDIPEHYIFIHVGLFFLPEFIAFIIIIGNVFNHGWNLYKFTTKRDMVKKSENKNLFNKGLFQNSRGKTLYMAIFSGAMS